MQIWATGDVSHADAIFAHDVELFNVIYGEAMQFMTSCLCKFAVCIMPSGGVALYAYFNPKMELHARNFQCLLVAGGEKHGMDTFKKMVSSIFKV
jgi:hypothetical protein